jgi:hypothetical protein
MGTILIFQEIYSFLIGFAYMTNPFDQKPTSRNNAYGTRITSLDIRKMQFTGRENIVGN